MTRLIGHRGASGHRPEHTESAYRLALELGVDAVEPDLVLSRDGVVVIRHEHDLSASTDVADRPEFAERRRSGFGEDGPVQGWFTEDFDWHELATLRAREPRPHIRPANAAWNDLEPILRFRDLLDLLDDWRERTPARQDVQLVAELKHANEFRALGMDLVAAVIADLRAAGWQPSDARLVFEAFEPEPLLELAGWGTRVLLIDEAHWPRDVWAAVAPFDGLSFDVEHLVIEPDLARALRARGKLAFAYTLRPENAFLPADYRSGTADAFGAWQDWFDRVLGSGLDAVFVDHPDLARSRVRRDT